MAEQRLEQLMKFSDPCYTAGSPLLLEASALYLDKGTSNCIAQLKWRNIDPRPIKAVMIELDGYDAFNQKLEPVHYQYDGLLVTQGSDFGGKTPIMIKNNKMVKYEVILKAVSFADEAIWRAESTDTFKPLPATKPQQLSGEILDQFKRDLSKQGNKNAALYCPQKALGLWQCGCGSWQYADIPCLRCRIPLDSLIDASDESTLAKNLLAYKEEQERLRCAAEERERQVHIAQEKAEAEKRKKQEEEARKREQERRIEERRARAAKKKRKIISVVATLIVMIVLAAAYAITQIVIPNNHYTQAQAAYNDGRYIDAYEAFSQAGNYKDSKEQAGRSAYAQAQVFLQQNDYEQAYSYFQLAADYSDAQSRGADVALLYAQQLQAQFDYQNAGVWFQKAGNSEGVTAAANMQYAVNSERTWLHSDTQDKPKTLPDGIFLFVTTTSTGKYSTIKEYGVVKPGEDGWITSKRNYTWVSYYPDHDLILAGTDSMCTVIDLRDNSMHDVQGVRGINHISDDGIVCYHNSEKGYSWENNGFFNRKGIKLTSTDFDWVRPFSEGLAAVERDGLWGYINTTGEVVIDYLYTDAESFENGYAKVEMDAHRVKEGEMYVSYDKGWGLIDHSGKRVIEPNWYELDYSEKYLNNGFVLVSKGYKRKLGLLDLNNNTIIEPIYSSIGIESEGLRYVRILQEGEQYYPCTTAGWMDSTGRMVIDLLALGIDGPREEDGIFINGCAIVSYWRKGGWSRDICDLVINNKGQIIWRGENDDWNAYQSQNGDIELSFYGKVNKEYVHEYKYYRTENGQMIEISETEYNQRNQRETVWWREETVTTVDLETAFYKQWSSVSSFSEDGIALVALNSRGPYGYVTEEEQVLVDAIYEDARDFTNGYAVVKLNGKWGCINANGQTIINPQYQLASQVSKDGTLYVQYDNGTYALINISGQVIVDDIHAIDDSEGNVDGELPMPGRCVFVRKVNQDRWLLLDSQGNQLF